MPVKKKIAREIFLFEKLPVKKKIAREKKNRKIWLWKYNLPREKLKTVELVLNTPITVFLALIGGEWGYLELRANIDFN